MAFLSFNIDNPRLGDDVSFSILVIHFWTFWDNYATINEGGSPCPRLRTWIIIYPWWKSAKNKDGISLCGREPYHLYMLGLNYEYLSWKLWHICWTYLLWTQHYDLICYEYNIMTFSAMNTTNMEIMTYLLESSELNIRANCTTRKFHSVHVVMACCDAMRVSVTCVFFLCSEVWVILVFGEYRS